MNRYDPEELSAKWLGQLDHLLSEARELWNAGKPRKPLLSFSQLPETDSRADQMAPAAAKQILGYQGRLVWGHFARAYIPAYIPGKNTHYGSVVYSADAEPADSIFELAWKVNELRSGKPVPRGTEEVARAIENDQSQFARIALPRELGVTGNCFFANLCIHRSRLPLGYIHDRLVPLLILPEKTQWCTLLPLRFWPDQLQAVWSSGPPAGDQARYRAMCASNRVEP